MTMLSISVPDDLFATLRRSPKEVEQEFRLAAALHWYARGLVTQGKAAEIAGLTRAEFIDALAREGVDTVQVDLEELQEELERG